MKRLIYMMAAAIAMTACNGKQAEAQSTDEAAAIAMTPCYGKQAEEQSTDEAATPAQTLINRLKAIQDSGLIAFGHHDDLAYGFTWEYEPGNSDVKILTGDYPAIASWDLGWIEVESPVNLDTVPFDYIRENALAHHNRGGINTISWHPLNPATGGSAWDLSDTTVMARITTEGDSLNGVMKQWAAHAADFVGSLKDADGNLIPVIFRPWHEHTGTWFWWGQGIATPEQYKALWKITRDAFDAKGLDNVVWAYSPDKSNCESVDDYMRCYPGDEYVDIMGADIYHFGGEAGNDIFAEWVKNTLGPATQMAKEHGKIVALTESGSETLPYPEWYTKVLYENVKDYPIAYIVVWRDAMPKMKKDHFYVPYKGHPAEADFIEFYNLPKTAFLNDIKDIK